ncbi:hypothetical protein [Chitinophaga qingshengii]|uniref:Uncharacterized protein n=1 Tax=Chitinophaga qingshengii TaxID=1569794 RepID=A0ABR7TQF9_9BACT|nr:hypothetical protein [Chitinophaga qingshengii]MBC9932702.1 hypothetical protein [Chitinophaga qingshengii]
MQHERASQEISSAVGRVFAVNRIFTMNLAPPDNISVKSRWDKQYVRHRQTDSNYF